MGVVYIRPRPSSTGHADLWEKENQNQIARSNGRTIALSSLKLSMQYYQMSALVGQRSADGVDDAEYGGA